MKCDMPYCYSSLGLTQDEVVGNLLLFLLAGYETTSGSLSFILYNLAIHPDVQEQLAQEIEDEIGDQVGLSH